MTNIHQSSSQNIFFSPLFGSKIPVLTLYKLKLSYVHVDQFCSFVFETCSHQLASKGLKYHLNQYAMYKISTLFTCGVTNIAIVLKLYISWRFFENITESIRIREYGHNCMISKFVH